jgi:hypothetical protein
VAPTREEHDASPAPVVHGVGADVELEELPVAAHADATSPTYAIPAKVSGVTSGGRSGSSWSGG